MEHERHHMVPIKAGINKVLMHCTGCSRKSWTPAKRCGPCDTASREYQEKVQARSRKLLGMSAKDRWKYADLTALPAFQMGCENCWKRYVVSWSPPCCCWRKGPPCEDCQNVPDRMLPHTCFAMTPEEIAYELKIKTMPKPKHGPSTVDHITAPLEMPSRN